MVLKNMEWCVTWMMCSYLSHNKSVVSCKNEINCKTLKMYYSQFIFAIFFYNPYIGNYWGGLYFLFSYALAIKFIKIKNKILLNKKCYTVVTSHVINYLLNIQIKLHSIQLYRYCLIHHISLKEFVSPWGKYFCIPFYCCFIILH